MKILSRRKDWRDITCNTSCKIIDIPVQSGLALTPARVQQLTEKGIAVSLPAANSEGLFTSSDAPFDFGLEDMYKRSVTREDLWETSQVSKERIMKARNRKAIVESQKKNE